MRFILIFFLCSAFLFQEEWELKRDKNGVKVYVKPGTQSKIKTVKATVSIKAPLEVVKSKIMDIENYSKWIYKCNEASILKRVSDNELFYYQGIKSPFPVKDRDLVAKMNVTENRGEILISLKAEPDFIEEKKDRVRIPVFDSSWKLKQSGESVEVINEINTDPGGGIPSKIINAFIVTGPYETNLRLKQQCEQKQ